MYDDYPDFDFEPRSSTSSGIVVALFFLAILASVFGTLFFMESRKPRLDQSMVEEFILQRKLEGEMKQVSMIPKDKGVVVRHEMIYTNQPEVLKAALEGQQQPQRGGQAGRRTSDPYEAIMHGFGIPYDGMCPDYHLMPDGSITVPQHDQRLNQRPRIGM